MKKIIIFSFFFLAITSCKEYIYTTKYHSPSTLFDKEQFIKNPNYWQYYIHDENGDTYKARSGSFQSNSLEAVIIKTTTVNIPDTLNKAQSNRKNEIHIYVKDSTIKLNSNKEKKLNRLKVHKNDVIEVISFMNPEDPAEEKNFKKTRDSATILGMIFIFFGFFLLSLAILINAIL